MGGRRRILEASAARALAFSRANDAKTGAEGSAAFEEAARLEAFDVVLRTAPPYLLEMSKAGRGAQALPAALALIAAVQAARADLPPSSVAAFLEKGIDPAGARAAVDVLTRSGRAKEAEKLSSLLRP
jgi:hypothetical protein